MKTLILLLPFAFLLTACGEGWTERMTAVGGLAVIENPKDYNVVCFVDSSGGGIHCITEDKLTQNHSK